MSGGHWGSSSTVLLSRAVDGTFYRSDSGAGAEASTSPPKAAAKHAKLGQLLSTSIAGNDLLSSCLYTGGICAAYAGKLAPLSLLLVSVMLYFFRFVYGEVVTAMPMNGGSYTALNNTTSKRIAALAACLSMISYVATAVVSAESAVQYLQLVVPAVPTLLGTVVVLAVFAALSLVGMGESAGVAAVMFVIHVAVLCVLCVWCAVYAVHNHWAVFLDNLKAPYPDSAGGSPALALYFGYAAALLGITGFETAANYVEEMKDSQTYVSTLRNLWLAVSLFNPLLGLLAMAVMPLSCSQVPGCSASPSGAGYDYIYKYQANLLGPVAGIVGGPAFKTLVCIDGVMVLAGSVLTAYVGVIGLVRRMALDRCLPAGLLATNSARGTLHWIILGFFAVCTSLLLALSGDVDMLSSVYNIAFLSVMSAFAVACGVLKWKRPRLARMLVTSPAALAAALLCVLAGLVGNVLRAPIVLAWFALYFGAVLCAVFAMFNATGLLGCCRRVVKACLPTEEERAQRRRRLQLILDCHTAKEAGEGESALLAHEQGEEEEEGEGGGGLGSSSSSTEGGLSPSLNQGSSRSAATSSRGSSSGSRGSSPLHAALLVPEERQGEASPGGSGDDVALGTGLRAYLMRGLNESIHALNDTPMVYFAKDGDLCTLNKVITYVRDNEQTHNLVIVHCAEDEEAGSEGGQQQAGQQQQQQQQQLAGQQLPPLTPALHALIANVAVLDAVYPKLRVDCLIVRGSRFSMPVVRWVSRYLGIGTNFMFIAMPSTTFPHDFSEEGLRIITRMDHKSRRGQRLQHAKEVIVQAAREVQKEE